MANDNPHPKSFYPDVINKIKHVSKNLHSQKKADADAKGEGIIEDEKSEHDVKHHFVFNYPHDRDSHAHQ